MDDAAEGLHFVICEPHLIGSVPKVMPIDGPSLVTGYGLAGINLPSPELLQTPFQGSIVPALHMLPRRSG